MALQTTSRRGRYAHHFFLHSSLDRAKDQSEAGCFLHQIELQNITTLPYIAEVHSNIVSTDTHYVMPDGPREAWEAAFKSLGRTPRIASCLVSVLQQEVKPAVQSLTLRFKRETWPTWETHTIRPAIEISYDVAV